MIESIGSIHAQSVLCELEHLRMINYLRASPFNLEEIRLNGDVAPNTAEIIRQAGRNSADQWTQTGKAINPNSQNAHWPRPIHGWHSPIRSHFRSTRSMSLTSIQKAAENKMKKKKQQNNNNAYILSRAHIRRKKWKKKRTETHICDRECLLALVDRLAWCIVRFGRTERSTAREHNRNIVMAFSRDVFSLVYFYTSCAFEHFRI